MSATKTQRIDALWSHACAWVSLWLWLVLDRCCLCVVFDWLESCHLLVLLCDVLSRDAWRRRPHARSVAGSIAEIDAVIHGEVDVHALARDGLLAALAGLRDEQTIGNRWQRDRQKRCVRRWVRITRASSRLRASPPAYTPRALYLTMICAPRNY